MSDEPLELPPLIDRNDESGYDEKEMNDSTGVVHGTVDLDPVESLELPPWYRRDPTAAGMQGKALHIEAWASKQRFKDRMHLCFGPLLVVMGLVMLGLLGSSVLKGEDPGGLAIVGGLMLVVMGMGTMMFKVTAQRMPLVVYEGGFTLTEVSFRQGLRRQESFVGWSRLSVVRLEESSLYNFATRTMKLVYDGDREQSLDSDNLEDPFALMLLFQRLVPGKLNRAFELYLGPPEKRRVISNPLPGPGRQYSWLMPLLLFLFINVILGAFLADLSAKELGPRKVLWSLLPFVVFGPFQFFLFRTIFELDRNDQRGLMEHRASAGPTGVTFPLTLLGRHVKRLRETIPWAEIGVVRMRLDPLLYYHKAQLETVSGERFAVPFAIYQALERVEGFEKVGWNYRHRHPASACPPLERRRPGRQVLFTLLACAPLLLVPLVSDSSWVALLDEARPALQRVCLTLVFLVLLPLYIFLRRRLAQRTRLGRDLIATDLCIEIPQAPARLRRIVPSQFISARVGQDRYSYYCELNTTQGSLKLPQSSAEALVKAGYLVENAGDLGTLPDESYLREVMTAAENGEYPTDERSPRRAGALSDREEVDLPERIAPGALLAAESPEDLVRYRRRTLLLTGVIFLMGLAFLGAAQAPMGWGQTMVLAGYLLGPAFMLLGLYLMRLAGRRKAVRIHENGLYLPDMALPGGELFIPYGRLKSLSEASLPAYGKGYYFHVDEQIKYFVSASFPGLADRVDELREKLGRPEYDCRSWAYPYDHIMAASQKIVYGVFFPLGLLVGLMVVGALRDADLFWPPLMKAATYGAPLVVLGLVYATYMLEFKEGVMRRKGPGVHIDERLFGRLVVAALLLFLVGLPFGPQGDEGMTIYMDEPPLGFERSGNITGENLTVNGSVYVAPGTRLNITDSRLRFQMSVDGGVGLYVAAGATLIIDNSTLSSVSSFKGYRFEIHGEATLANSTFSGLYGPAERYNGDGGIEIYSNEVRLVDCVVRDNPTNGLLIYKADPLILRTTLSGNGDDGIEMHGSSARVLASRLVDNGWAMVIFSDSTPLVTDSYIGDNDHGLAVDHSRPVLRGNTFANNRAYAIELIGGTDLEYHDNTFVDNGVDYTEEQGLDHYLTVCCSLVMLISLVPAAAIYVKVRRRRLETQVAATAYR